MQLAQQFYMLCFTARYTQEKHPARIIVSRYKKFKIVFPLIT